MKRTLKIGIVLLALILLFGGAYLYFFVISPKTTASVLIYWGNHAIDRGNVGRASRLYGWAYELDDTNTHVALSLAQSYAKSGNYTKAEYVLLTTKKAHPENIDLYLELSRVFIAQDKLLDAQMLLDGADTSVFDRLDAMRPAAPVFTPEGGYYAEYIDLDIDAESGKLYVSLDKEYPSVFSPPFEKTTLPGGTTVVRALVVENGLVSPLTTAEYTITGVIERVQLTDPALDSYVRDLLCFSPTQKMLTSDLWGITELVIPEETASLDDLSYFVGLQSLTLTSTCGSDLSFLTQMPDLQNLSLVHCTATSDLLEVIGGCTELKTLNLSDCGLSTIAPLSGLNKLEVFDLSENFISDLTPLNGCADLRELNLSDNAITDTAQLSANTALVILNLSSNALESVSGLKHCTKLEELYLSNNSLDSLACIASMPHLRILDASKNDLLRVDEIGSCPELERVDLSENVLEAIDGMENLSKLVYLNINYNDVKEIPDFPDDSCLQQIFAAHNFLENLEGLQNLQQLNYVDMDYNNIDSSDIEWLLTCPMLVQINAFGTNVDNIDAFDNTSIIVNYNPT